MAKFQCHTVLPSQDTKQNVLLSIIQTIDDSVNFKNFLRSSSKAMADREQGGGWKNKTLNISRTKRAF